ncbi:MAG: hypothetical protein BKP49_08770 [Treponema sp. CETP13]|nr:MAG: hypothetical protein BKP49_08770 [Treponema sp. CETP13]
MNAKIAQIKVKKRIRQDVGDLQPLMDSLKRYGLLNPIVVSENYELIAGERRLRAAIALGWETIPITITSSPDKISQLEIEIEENVVRQDFSREELLDAYSTLEKLRNPSFIKRIINSIKLFFSNSFSIRENQKKNKHKKNALLSLFLLIGILFLILETATYQSGNNIVVTTFLSIIGIIFIIIGLFYFIKFLTGLKK